MKESMKRQLYFTLREKRGVIVFLFLSFLVLCFTYYQSTFIPEEKIDKEKIEQIALKIEAERQELQKIKEAKNRKSKWKKYNKFPEKNIESKKKKPKTVNISYFVFDPNLVSKEELQRLGIKSYVANNFIKYRKAGAVFRSNQDILKIYGMEEYYENLEEYIHIDTSGFINTKKIYAKNKPSTYPNKKPRYEKPKYKKLHININTANAEELSKLYGIGPSISKGIVKYRELLGGYVEKSQLKQVYNLSDTTYNNIQDQIYVDGAVKQIDINTATKEEFAKHYLIGYKKGAQIVKYRRQHGKYKTVKDLLKIKSFTQEYFVQIEPYLRINQLDK